MKETYRILLKNGHLLPVATEGMLEADILVEDGKIKKISPSIEAEGAEIIDLNGQTVTPGLIDVHSHTSVISLPSTLPNNDNDANEMTKPITASIRALDALDPFDYSISKVREAGFTTLYTGPGSANLIGGLGVAYHPSGLTADEMIIYGTEQMKMALGENPKRCFGGDKGVSPMTRMGNAALIRETLHKALEYHKKLEKAEKDGSEKPDYQADLEALRPFVRGEKRVRIHCHKAIDITTAIRLCEEFGLKYALEHVTEGWMIVDFLKEKNPYCVVGPLLLSPMKKELWNIRLDNAAILSNAGLKVCLTADTASETVWLPLHAGIMIREGMSLDNALKALTLYPAEILGLDDQIGTLEVGKQADIAVFSGSPFEINSKCTLNMIKGKVVFTL